MLKPFYNKKKNIDNRLLPSATVADAGKVVGVTEDGKFGLVGGGNTEPYPKGTIQLKIVKVSDEDPETVDLSANTLIMYADRTVILIPNAITVTSEYQAVEAYVLGPAYIQRNESAVIHVTNDIEYAALVDEVIENCTTVGIMIIPFNNFNIKYMLGLVK